ncbi:MAG: bifunctional diaminohydroxyphosphoribosylaminopyrimidine deaminase/5-amino-6-(5-phosphoribosylamino)uracil reductase RibD [Candidatus Omnitrophica bacterium]|nr:bifunctional diaminohydroxyphosphoribosylaminopyrimidine deaminase/5-amino-6-(5-phosphoribosylamino)uracil reductase RibD [Candidatus Omnitrophota bacterium]MBD3269428.1 bifunctional diaminohydroxyphosphoribosylaminopyrimidine deaminase/5-amino-6-(5-phosphoribosylamino)uracil reductase RibD [Candidatus Omnitrophota bacterium]
MKGKDKDILFMEKALALAAKGEGFTSPNPMVGALIVKNGKVISRGYHKKAGSAHAEREAIEKAGVSLKGATIYITLEPCCHFGRTPPCVDEIINKKFARVVIATEDPNVMVSGKSVAKLKKAGIEVKVGVCRQKSVRLNEIFFKNQKQNLPFVAVKIAQTLDGKIASCRGVSKWITSEIARDYAKKLRDKYDCVLIGANTLRMDDPSLNGRKKTPFKAIISGSCGLLPANRLFSDSSRNIVITSRGRELKGPDFPAQIIKIKAKNNIIPPRAILKEIYKLGIMSVFVEGGATTNGYFFRAGLVDKVYCFIAPKILGGKKALSSVGGEGFDTPGRCPVLEDVTIDRVGPDILVRGYPVRKRG